MSAVYEHHRLRDALPGGTRLGTYEVESILGHGGFGIVYRARHLDLDSVVAIKEFLPVELAVRDGSIVHPRSANCVDAFEDARKRFLEEAKSLIRFRSHPCVITCLEFFRANGTAYLVMEYEEGMPLSEVLRRREIDGRPFDQGDLLAIAEPLLEGLSRVHEAGVLHRDIKPSNILVRRKDGRPVLIDFGAAKQTTALNSKSLAPVTEGYAAIEQVGDGKLGPWTDLYAFGAVLWRIVAGGQPPWRPPNPIKVETRLNARVRGSIDPLPMARELGAGRFSAAILDAIDLCLELAEANRVQDCGQLLRLLKAGGRVVRQPEVECGNGGPSANPGKLDQHNYSINWRDRPNAAVIAITLLAMILGGAVWFGTDRAPTIADLQSEGQVASAGGSVPDRSSERPNEVTRRENRSWAFPSAPTRSPELNPEVDDKGFGYSRRKHSFSMPTSIGGGRFGGSPPPREEGGEGIELSNLTRSPEPRPGEEHTRRRHSSSMPTSIGFGLHPERSSVAPGERLSQPRNPKPSESESKPSAAPASGLTSQVGPHSSTTEFAGSTDRLAAIEIGSLGLPKPSTAKGVGDASTSQQARAAEARNSNNPDPLAPPSTLTRAPGAPRPSASTSTNRGSRLQHHTSEGAASTFTRGSHRDDVLRLQGTPDSISRYDALGREVWKYGRSTVEISTGDGRVRQWANRSGNLRARLEAGSNVTGAQYFTRGSHRDDVLRLQGTPDSISRYDALGHEVWKYGRSTVEISTGDGRVRQWANRSGNLRARLEAGSNVTGAQYFTRGSHRDDVLRLQGTPDSISRYDALGHEVWKYGRSTVEISTGDGRVRQWANRSGNLRARLEAGSNVTGAQYFTRGSHRDAVLRLQGTPDSISRYDALGHEVWKYGRSTVEISTGDGRVRQWANRSGNLRARLEAGSNVTETVR